MKIVGSFIAGVLLLTTQSAMAAQVAKTAPKQLPLAKLTKSFHKLTKLGTRYNRPFAAMVYPGSLKSNVVRIARQNGWGNVVWKPDEDFKWTGKTTIVANGLPGIYEKLLSGFPVRAVFYKGNHVLVILPRDLK